MYTWEECAGNQKNYKNKTNNNLLLKKKSGMYLKEIIVFLSKDKNL
jgi:hypothetical protein